MGEDEAHQMKRGDEDHQEGGQGNGGDGGLTYEAYEEVEHAWHDYGNDHGNVEEADRPYDDLSCPSEPQAEDAGDESDI